MNYGLGPPPPFPRYFEPWRVCPITGLYFPESEGRWRRGRWVHRLAFDAPAYREVIIETPPIPTQRRWTTPPDLGGW